MIARPVLSAGDHDNRLLCLLLLLLLLLTRNVKAQQEKKKAAATEIARRKKQQAAKVAQARHNSSLKRSEVFFQSTSEKTAPTPDDNLRFHARETQSNPYTPLESNSCTFGEIEACLERRSILVMGTSVSRHWFFELQSALSRDHGRAKASDPYLGYMWRKLKVDHNSDQREVEKKICGGGAGAYGFDGGGKTHGEKAAIARKRLGLRASCSFTRNTTRTVVLYDWYGRERRIVVHTPNGRYRF